MSYTAKTLLPNEKIIYYTKPHYMLFYPTFLWLGFATCFLIIANMSLLFGSLLFVIGLADGINNFFIYTYSEYVITDKRIIMKTGFIRRRSLELFLNRIEGAYVEQNMLGQLFDFGTVIINGIGGTPNPFFFVPKPITFRNSIQDKL